MSNVPDINLMRETAEEKTVEFNEEFAKSEVFTKMCSDIQKSANEGNFTRMFNASSYGGIKSLTAAKELFLKHGYSSKILEWNLLVSWGRTYEETEE